MHVPNGICTGHLDRCRLQALGGLLRNAASGSSANIMREEDAAAKKAKQDAEENNREAIGLAEEAAAAEAHVRTIDDYFHMGIALTDGMGLIAESMVWDDRGLIAESMGGTSLQTTI